MKYLMRFFDSSSFFKIKIKGSLTNPVACDMKKIKTTKSRFYTSQNLFLRSVKGFLLNWQNFGLLYSNRILW